MTINMTEEYVRALISLSIAIKLSFVAQDSQDAATLWSPYLSVCPCAGGCMHISSDAVVEPCEGVLQTYYRRKNMLKHEPIFE